MNETRLINLTRHAFRIRRDDGSILELPASATPAHVKTTTAAVGYVQGVAIRESLPGIPVNVPPPQSGTLYIVPAIVRTACPERTDLASPGLISYDEGGGVQGCTFLTVNPPILEGNR